MSRASRISASKIIRGTLYKYRRTGSITKFSITRPQNLGFLISLHFSRAPVNLLLPTNLPSNFFLSSPSPLSRTAYKICTHSARTSRRTRLYRSKLDLAKKWPPTVSLLLAIFLSWPRDPVSRSKLSTPFFHRQLPPSP